ncbi:hypothetical protein V2G26_012043 [Clonostachys chloroleuca]
MASATLTEDANKKDASVDIAVNGDVAFIVGPSCRRLRVYSLVLTNASTVFNAMLGPQFKEGHQLAQPGLTEIELPEETQKLSKSFLTSSMAATIEFQTRLTLASCFR